ncbi:MAG TPA: RagB/SusD family nutrient uptake outer membrane protein [Longimicrobiaceae bacterium]|nr:RagB/SusD family nutrient uptake outer membrane protein [Longimicrobiaceae bacterium]
MGEHRGSTLNHQAREMNGVDRWRRGAHRALGRGLAALGVALFAAGCNVSDLLDVETPDRIPEEGLVVPANAQLLVNGAVGDFECAAGAYIALGGVMAGELTDATQTAARWPYDRRNVQSSDALYGTSDCEALGVYTPLSRARFSADNILGNLQKWTDAEVANRQQLIARSAAIAGYSYLLLAEGFCSATVNQGPELSTQQLLDSAVVRFSTAIAAAQAANAPDLLNLARVGRARAYLDKGQGAQALADAQQVPANFEFVITASSTNTRRNNRIFAQNGQGATGGTALSVGEAYRNVTFAGVPDRRVAVVDAGRKATDGTPVFFQTKYGSLGAPIPLATGDEARLIIAEVQGGQTAVDIINAFHARAGLPAFAGGTAQEIRQQVIEERRRELFLEGHRLFDIRRLNLPLSPAPGTPYRKGGLYGDSRCFPLPDVEIRNNPNI